MLTLYQFPISHYCEKVRWALDFKGVPHRTENWLPGLHLRKTRGFVPRTSVPILQTGDQVIQGSGEILSWLDERYPDRALTPADPGLRARALEWEVWADEELGVHVRRFAYHTLLEYPELVQPFFTRGGKWWWKPFVRLTFPKMRQVMRRFMAIDDEGADESRRHIEAALETLSRELSGRDYLVGDTFTRADLAAAALVAPLIMAEGYGLEWPERMPEPLQGWAEQWGEKMEWADRMYKRHR